MDPRNFSAGREIPSQYYVDQPYFVVTPGGEWVCVLTTGGDREGRPGQHISATISADQGKTWSELIPIESPNGPDAGWAVPLITPSGRIYVFYTYNGDPVHAGRDQDDQWYFWHHTPPPGIVFERSNLHGWYAFKFSDDGGRTWSEDLNGIPDCTLLSNGWDRIFDQIYAARSKHVGGVHASHCDGSARFYRDEIDALVWQALSTSQGAEDADYDG